MTEEQVRFIVRDEMARIMAPKVSAGEVEERPKPVTPESLFVDIVMAANVRNWTEIVIACEQQGLTDDLIASSGRLDYETYKKLNHKFKALDAGDMTRLGLEAPHDFSTIGILVMEYQAMLADAKAEKDAAAAEAVKPVREVRNGMTRNEVFVEEDARRKECFEAGVGYQPLPQNQWAFRQCA